MKDQPSLAQAIIRQFAIPAAAYTSQPYGSGHINDTFIVSSQATGQPQYLLQRINHQVFTNVHALMENSWKVTSHLQQKLQPSSSFKIVNIIPLATGKLYYQDEAGHFWRMQTFLPDSVSYDVVSSAAQAQQAGIAFGKFQALLSDLPADSLHITIPDFHNIEKRFWQLQQAIEADPLQRKAAVQADIETALAQQSAMLICYQLIREGKIPGRITHNDTKFNNVLLHKTTQQAMSVIDLDTVMPGVILYDFGDAVRTIANTAAEDAGRLEEVGINLTFYEAFARGFLQETKQLLTQEESSQLAFSAQYMTCIMGLRFLTDYLAGDVYYKIHFAAHNLQRARAQFRLLKHMQQLHAPMQAIIQQLLT